MWLAYQDLCDFEHNQVFCGPKLFQIFQLLVNLKCNTYSTWVLHDIGFMILCMKHKYCTKSMVQNEYMEIIGITMPRG